MTSAVEALRLLHDIGPVLFIAASLATAVLIVVLRPLLRRYTLARPNARSSHKVPIPQGGGIAVISITIVATAIALFSFPQLQADGLAQLNSVFAAATLLAILGAIDDISVLDAIPRLMLQIAAVVIVLYALPTELRVLPQLPFWVERVLLLLAGVWFINLVNFMDGIDWMTVAEVVPVTAGLVVLGIIGALPSSATLVAIALCGAMIGFAPFNRPIAKLFLGDVGSLPIGLLLGWLLLLLAGNGHLIAAVLLPLYYLADASITLLIRLTNRLPVLQAHRTHFYQRATDRGFSVIEIVARVFAVNLGLVMLALATVMAPGHAMSLASLAAGAALVAWLLFVFTRANGEPCLRHRRIWIYRKSVGFEADSGRTRCPHRPAQIAQSTNA